MCPTTRWQPPPYSNATEWLVERQCFVESSEEYTHLLLDGFRGGKVYVSSDCLFEFYKCIEKDAKEEKQNFIVEQKSDPVFPFFLDIDCEDESDMTSVIENEWIPEIQALVRSCVQEGDQVDYHMVICKAPTKKKGNLVKSGVHVHWPGIPVNKDVALELRSFIVSRLHTKFGPRPETNSWNAVVDSSIMLDNGLRMLYSLKCVRCGECSKKFRILDKELQGCKGGGSSARTCPCAYCRRKADIRRECSCVFGKIHENRPYTFVSQTDSEGSVDYDPPSIYHQLRMTSVRIYDEMENVVPATVVAPSDHDEDLVEQPRCRKNRNKRAHDRPSALYPAGPSNANGTLLPKDSEEYKAICKLLTGVVLTNAFKDGEGQSSVYWVWSRSRDCRNVHRMHERNNVWFEVNRHGWFQRCFDDECRGYRSDPGRIPSDISVQLFSTTKKLQIQESPMSSAGERLLYRIVYDPKKSSRGRRANQKSGGQRGSKV